MEVCNMISNITNNSGIRDFSRDFMGGTVSEWVCTIIYFGILGFILVDPVEHLGILWNTVVVLFGTVFLFFFGG